MANGASHRLAVGTDVSAFIFSGAIHCFCFRFFQVIWQPHCNILGWFMLSEIWLAVNFPANLSHLLFICQLQGDCEEEWTNKINLQTLSATHFHRYDDSKYCHRISRCANPGRVCLADISVQKWHICANLMKSLMSDWNVKPLNGSD